MLLPRPALAGLAALLAAGALSACEPSAYEPKSQAYRAAQQASSPASANSIPACLPVPRAARSAISAALNGGATISEIGAVKSTEHPRVWFVSAILDVPGTGDAAATLPATWATNGIDGTGLWISLGGMAQQFSSYPDARSTTLGVSSRDAGARAAQNCIGR